MSTVTYADVLRKQPPKPVQEPAATDYKRLPKAARAEFATMIHSLVELFQKDKPTYADHWQAINANPASYESVLRLMLKRGVELSFGTKSRILAVYLALRRKDMVEFLLGGEANGLLGNIQGRADVFGLPELLKALKLLDAPRYKRQLQKKLEMLEGAGASPATAGKVRNTIDSLDAEPVTGGSLSGAVARYVRNIVSRVPVSKLDFFALQLPAEPWKELADLVHLNPASGVALPWFMPRVFGETPPDDSIVKLCEKMQKSGNLAKMIAKVKPPYSFLRVKFQLSDEAKVEVAKYAPLAQCIWWYEELSTGGRALDKIIFDRLGRGEEISLNYGKVMERIQMLKHKFPNSELLPILLRRAEAQLESIDVPLEPPVAVLGDASSSMSVAVRVATIISSIISALCEGQIVFFNHKAFRPKRLPHNVQDVLAVAQETRASGSTSPAAALNEFYSKKKKVKTFVVVTDEEENTVCDGMYFAPMMDKYRKEVFPASVVFISFLYGNGRGYMQQALDKYSIPYRCYRLDNRRPDLTKLDSFLAMMSLSNPSFHADVYRQEMQHSLDQALAKAAAVDSQSQAASAAPGAETSMDASASDASPDAYSSAAPSPQQALADALSDAMDLSLTDSTAQSQAAPMDQEDN